MQMGGHVIAEGRGKHPQSRFAVRGSAYQFGEPRSQWIRRSQFLAQPHDIIIGDDDYLSATLTFKLQPRPFRVFSPLPFTMQVDTPVLQHSRFEIQWLNKMPWLSPAILAPGPLVSWVEAHAPVDPIDPGLYDVVLVREIFT
jgi:hypothetical protein